MRVMIRRFVETFTGVRSPFLRMLLCAGALLAGQSTVAGAESRQGGDELVQLMLGAGDSVAVRFTDPFCLSRLEEGQRVAAVVAETKVISSLTVIKEGAPVALRVEEVEGNGHKGKPGRMTLVFESVEAVDGVRVPLGDPGATVELSGHGRNILAKIFTLFLIKGTDPCVGVDDRFYPKFAQSTAVMVPPR